MVDFIDWWNPSWKGLPWKAWTSPIERYQVCNSFKISNSSDSFTFLIVLALTDNNK